MSACTPALARPRLDVAVPLAQFYISRARATVLRVLGRDDEALASCEHLTARTGPAIATLCTQGVQGLDAGQRVQRAVCAAYGAVHDRG